MDYYSTIRLILIYCPSEGGRLSRPRQCSQCAACAQSCVSQWFSWKHKLLSAVWFKPGPSRAASVLPLRPTCFFLVLAIFQTFWGLLLAVSNSSRIQELYLSVLKFVAVQRPALNSSPAQEPRQWGQYCLKKLLQGLIRQTGKESVKQMANVKEEATNRAISTKPQEDVACSAVQPSLSQALTSAPRSTRNFTILKLSSMHAYKAVTSVVNKAKYLQRSKY